MEIKETVSTTTAFGLGKLGQYATDQFAQRIAPLGLRPRHCGVLELLRADRAGIADAQHNIAAAMRVSNSVVVNMLDELEELGAVRRVREPSDRRRQRVELTSRGQSLARQAARHAHELDLDLLAPLGEADAAALRTALSQLARHHGLPG